MRSHFGPSHFGARASSVLSVSLLPWLRTMVCSLIQALLLLRFNVSGFHFFPFGISNAISNSKCHFEFQMPFRIPNAISNFKCHFEFEISFQIRNVISNLKCHKVMVFASKSWFLRQTHAFCVKIMFFESKSCFLNQTHVF